MISTTDREGETAPPSVAHRRGRHAVLAVLVAGG